MTLSSRNFWKSCHLEVEEFLRLRPRIWVLFFILFLLGSYFRIFNLVNNVGYYFDMVETQYLWGRLAFENGVAGFWQDYPMKLHYDYPPISLIYEYLVYFLAKFFGGGVLAFVAILKLINWLFDLVLMGVVLAFGRHFQPEKKSLCFLLAAITYAVPSVWFVSGVWGQNDTLMVLITIWSLAVLVPFRKSPEVENLKSWWNNRFFGSGVILSIGFWIKQQPILLFPVLFVFFAQNRSWKDLGVAFRWLMVFAIPIAILSTIYFESQLGFYNPWYYVSGVPEFFEKLGLNFEMITNWGILANFGFILVILPWLILFSKRFQKGNWYTFKLWLLGFFTVTTAISVPFFLLNYQRYARVALAAVIRGDAISNGATTFWGLFPGLKSASDVVLNLGFFGLSLKLAGLLLYIFFMATFLWFKLDLTWLKVKNLRLDHILAKKLFFRDYFELMFVNTSLYFLFFPNMHSRYFHFTILFWFLLIFTVNFQNRWRWFLWILGGTVFNFFYFLNQTLVFTANNSSPAWVSDFLILLGEDRLGISFWWLCSLGIFLGFGATYVTLLRREKLV